MYITTQVLNKPLLIEYYHNILQIQQPGWTERRGNINVSVSPSEFLPRRSGLHPEEEESVAGRFASSEQRRDQTELQTQSSLQRAGGRHRARCTLTHPEPSKCMFDTIRLSHSFLSVFISQHPQKMKAYSTEWMNKYHVRPLLCCRRGGWRLLPDPAPAVCGYRGDQHRWDRLVLHPGGHLLQHLHRLHSQRRLLRHKRTEVLGRAGTLAAPPDLVWVVWRSRRRRCNGPCSVKQRVVPEQNESTWLVHRVIRITANPRFI